ncbi:MAG: HWE histidine kinase domain-containing protein [Rhodomicrobium sp.]
MCSWLVSDPKEKGALVPVEQAEALRKQRAVLSQFGRDAFRTGDIQELLQRATELVSDALEVDLVKVLELQPGGKTVLVRAGVNWAPGVVGHATLDAGSKSPAGYALKTKEPVISPDIDKENRFEIPQLLREHGVKSTVNVIIQGEREPFGVLEVDARKQTDFSTDDADFLHNYANLIAGAVDRVAAHEQIRVMLDELHHRMRNMMANIQIIAQRTKSSSSSLDDFMERFTDRLQALARSQNVLTRGAKGGAASLRELLRAELAAYDAIEGERIFLDGDDIEVPGEVAWALSLIFHELMTNAQKHGALTFETGTINVSWKVDGRVVRMRWRESGLAIAPVRVQKGFGSNIIEDAMPRSLGGGSTLVFHPDGIEYTLEFALPDTSS